MNSLIDEIKKNYGIDVTNNIIKVNENYILLNNNHFNFLRIFVENLNYNNTNEDFVLSSISEKNNVSVLKKYYHCISDYYAQRDHLQDSIILYKK